MVVGNVDLLTVRRYMESVVASDRSLVINSTSRLLKWLLCAFVVSIGFDSLDWSAYFGEGDTLSTYVGLALALLFFMIRGKNLRLVGPEKKWFILFVLGSGVAVIINIFDRNWANFLFLRPYFTYIQIFVLYVIVKNIVLDKPSWSSVINVYLTFYICISVIANIRSAFASMGPAGRLSILSRNPNGLAFSCGIVAILLFSWLLQKKHSGSWKTVMLCFALVSAMFTIIATGSRGGAIAIGVGLLMVTLIAFQSSRLPRFIFIIPIVLGVFLYIGTSSNSVLVSRMQAAIEGTDMGARPEIGAAAFEIFKENLLSGIGADYVYELGWRTNSPKKAAHNAYLQIAVSFGLLGLIPFVGFLISTLINAWKCRKTDEGPAMVGIQVMLLVFFVGASAAYSKDVWILFAIIQNTGVVHRLNVFNKQIAI